LYIGLHQVYLPQLLIEVKYAQVNLIYTIMQLMQFYFHFFFLYPGRLCLHQFLLFDLASIIKQLVNICQYFVLIFSR
jgi:hypothetical protein